MNNTHQKDFLPRIRSSIDLFHNQSQGWQGYRMMIYCHANLSNKNHSCHLYPSQNKSTLLGTISYQLQMIAWVHELALCRFVHYWYLNN